MAKALLIIDIQNDHFKNGKMELVGTKKASENAKILLEKCRNENLTIMTQYIRQSYTLKDQIIRSRLTLIIRQSILTPPFHLV
jgi:nicotinamidase-related amidase